MAEKGLFKAINIGAELLPLAKEVTLLQMAMFAGATWSFFRIHWDKEYAQSQGITHANMQASLFGAFLSQLLTDWMGQEGELRKLSFQNRVMCFSGDRLTCKGRVVSKYTRDNQGWVECDAWVENQRDENVAPGKATLCFPDP